MTAPERTHAQRMAALENATRVRIFRAQMKKAVKAGRQDVCALIAAPPPEAETMKLHALLLATPKFGTVKANNVLKRAQVSPSKTLGGLSERQRRETVRLMRR